MWGVIVDGDGADVQLWHDSLCRPFDPWMEYRNSFGKQVSVVRSGQLDGAVDATQAYEIAQGYISALNGAFLLEPGVLPLSIIGIGELDQNGQIKAIVSASIAASLGRATVRATATTGSNARPTPSGPQKLIDLASNNDLVADLLSHRSRGANWYDLYKTFEAVKELCKGGKDFAARSWYPGAQTISQFTQTANRFRHFSKHSSQNGKLNAMSLEEANRLVGLMAKGALDRL